MKKRESEKKLTAVSTFHYFRLACRSILFILLLIAYLSFRIHGGTDLMTEASRRPAVMVILFLVFTAEMILRFFPSNLESPGCQKQFARNYQKTGKTDIVVPDNNATILVLLVWICFNAIFGALYMKGVIDEGIMLLLSSAYSVCDMICILFFCPFQTWFLKNKCCVTCRIYNWDYAMMFTPLFFVAKPYTWGLLALSVALLVRWELTFYRHPERFCETTNDYLRCENCSEKLCAHKKQLMVLWKQAEEYRARRRQRLQR